MLVVTTLPGGSRVVAAFGNRPKSVSWSGKLYGSNISPRIRQMRLYAVSGQQVQLVWSNEVYAVVVKEFTPTYCGGYAEYEITVEVVKDSNGAFTVSSATTIDQQISGLQAQADAANAAIMSADPTGSQVFQGAYQTAKSAVQSSAPIAQNIVQAAAEIVPAVLGAVTAVKGYASGQAPSSLLFANATTLVNALNNINGNVQRGQSASGVVVQGGNLFGLSAQQYGDVTQAFALAQANGLSSPFLSALKSTFVALPPLLGK
jgi:hypothetical protein